jgi:Spy/CpxP family protein refolding chaperone
VILLCGVAIGGVITAVVLEPRPVHGMRRPERLPERIVQEMQDKYNLTDEQERQLLAIFEEHGKKLSDIRAEVQPRVEAEHEALRGAVEAVLTPEQAEQWRKEFEQMRRPWRLHGGESPGAAERR